MNKHKSVNDKLEGLSTGISDTVKDLIREAKPLLHHASALTQQSAEAALKGKRRMEATGNDMLDQAANMIRQEPFKAMLIAAGAGAVAVVLIGLMTPSRPHHRHLSR